MATRAQLSTYSYNKKDTAYAQKALNQFGGYGLAVDGIYGAKTKAAVKKFQKENGLTEDGILGKNTWAALEKHVAAQEKAADEKVEAAQAVYDPARDENYQQILKQLEKEKQTLAAIENPFSDYQRKLDALSNQQANHTFSYDMAADPLYQQYKRQFTRQGQLAMLDTMGKAAALTGGFGSSYGQLLGQQAYQDYTEKLGSILPQLYDMALDRHQLEAEALQDRYGDMLDEAKLAYADYESAKKTRQDAVDSLTEQAVTAYKNGYEKWYDAYKNAYTEKKDLYSAIVKLISQTGYIPPAEQLKKAGMTAAEAKAYQKAYKS